MASTTQAASRPPNKSSRKRKKLNRDQKFVNRWSAAKEPKEDDNTGETLERPALKRIKVEKEEEAKRLTDLPLLAGAAHDDLKKRLRARKKLLKQLPRLTLTPRGAAAETGVAAESRLPLTAADVQLLVLYAMMGDKMQEKEIG